LELLIDAKIDSGDNLMHLLSETGELIAIFTTIMRKTKRNT
jgi:hypothetical protein